MLTTRVWPIVITCGVVAALAMERPSAQSRLESQYWLTHGGFPEAARLNERRQHDLAIAFSGGGTRSAAATLGQLRALHEVGWLSRVRYVSAASGGAWGAVPYAFSPRDEVDLLGAAVRPECKPQLPPGHGETAKPCGLLAESIANSSLLLCGLRAYLADLATSDLLKSALKLINRGCNNAGQDTYTTLIGRIFLTESVCPNCAVQPFTWDQEAYTELRMKGGPDVGFTLAPRNRPFMIMTGTLIIANANWTYPRLAQLEITPYYSGVRAFDGRSIGGSYVASWAYGALPIEPRVHGDDRRVEVAERGPLTLQAALGITGSAPLLSAYVIPQLARARAIIAGMFPRLNAWSILPPLETRPAEDGPKDRISLVTGELSHGDGGFLDNLALMPLLARKARNIIVFVNPTDEFRVADDLEQYFRAIPKRTFSGDRTRGVVFDETLYEDIQKQFEKRRDAGEAPIACSDPKHPWSVKANPYHGIRAYTGLNICFLYTHLARKWLQDEPMPPELRVTLPVDWKLPARFCDQFDARGRRKDKRKVLKESLEARQIIACQEFARLPWYRTFEESFNFRTFNVEPIKLSLSQVNMLSAFTHWSVMNARADILAALPELSTRETSAAAAAPAPR
jgi:hypothetical protein